MVMINDKFINSILTCLNVPHTTSFVKQMCMGSIQSNNLFGIVRLLEVFGVRSRAVRIGDSEDFMALELPYICSMSDDRFVLVTKQNDKGLVYTDGAEEKETEWAEFVEKSRMLAVMLSADSGSAEPWYKENRRKERYQNCLWAIPAIWLIWLLLMQFVRPGNPATALPSLWFRISGILLSAMGLFLSVLLHRQWTGDGNAVERVCSHFKTSNCSSAHDSFFFNKWFDLSEVGISFFISIILIIALLPAQSYSAAWMILPALPASLWNLAYQFFKQKHWCPLCVTVQILFWIMAAVFLLCGAYEIPENFNICDIIQALLLWGTVLVAILKCVTPAVQNRHNAERARISLSSVKGDKKVIRAVVGDFGSGQRRLTVAVSPTCPYCKRMIEKIDHILLPTGRFTLEKMYKPIHKGDEEKIEGLIGREEAEKHYAWCDEHDIKATPTVFVNDEPLDSVYDIEDLLYL